MLTIEPNKINRESPLRKKGKPNNIDETTLFQTETYQGSNTHNEDMDVEGEEIPTRTQYHSLQANPQPQADTGKPNNLDKTSFSQIDTPTRSNRHDITTMEVEEEEIPLGPQYVPLPPSPKRNQPSLKTNTDNDEQKSTATTRPTEGEWITKEKKDKRTTRNMTQTKYLIQ